MIYTSFSPNTRCKDLRENIKLLIQPSSWQEGKYTVRVKKWFKDKYHTKHVYTFNYARSALYTLLQSLRLNPSNEIIIQAFTCIAVPNPFRWAGATVKYVDIDPKNLSLNLNQFRKAISDETRVVIVQHTFGIAGPIEEVITLARQHNLLVIEDCTNLLDGGRPYKGRPPNTPKSSKLGTRGDAAIFSLGRDKAASGVDGGVLVVNNPGLSEPVNKIYQDLPYPTHQWLRKELWYPLFWQLIKSTYDLQLGKLFHFLLTKSGLLTRATTTDEKQGLKPDFIPAKLPNALAQLAYTQLQDIDEINKHRNQIVNFYRQNLSGISKIKCFDYPDRTTFLRFPLLAKKRDELIKYLRNKKIFVGDWYTVPIAPKEVVQANADYHWGSCPIAEKICQEIINLPCHVNVSLEDAKRIVESIKSFYKENK